MKKLFEKNQRLRKKDTCYEIAKSKNKNNSKKNNKMTKSNKVEYLSGGKKLLLLTLIMLRIS